MPTLKVRSGTKLYLIWFVHGLLYEASKSCSKFQAHAVTLFFCSSLSHPIPSDFLPRTAVPSATPFTLSNLDAMMALMKYLKINTVPTGIHALWSNWDSPIGVIWKFEGKKWDTLYQLSKTLGAARFCEKNWETNFDIFLCNEAMMWLNLQFLP